MNHLKKYLVTIVLVQLTVLVSIFYVVGHFVLKHW